MGSNTLTVLILLVLSSFTAPEKTNKPIKNIVFIGSTGSGKSTACNLLYSRETEYPFTVGHTASAETERVVGLISSEKGIRIIDTPGFGDNRFDEKHISSIIRQFTQVILDGREDDFTSPPMIHAFVLVTRLTPRAATLKADLERVRDLFGTVALKSLIILAVYNDGLEGSAQIFMRDLKKMKKVSDILQEGKGDEKPNEKWFVVWNNMKSNNKQETDLLLKINRLEAYTNEKFIEADEEIRNRINENMREAINIESEKLKRQFSKNEKALEDKLQELSIRIEEQRLKQLEEREKARQHIEEVSHRSLINAATIATGAGIGAKAGMNYGPMGAVAGGLLGGLAGNFIEL